MLSQFNKQLHTNRIATNPDHVVILLWLCKPWIYESSRIPFLGTKKNKYTTTTSLRCWLSFSKGIPASLLAGLTRLQGSYLMLQHDAAGSLCYCPARPVGIGSNDIEMYGCLSDWGLWHQKAHAMRMNQLIMMDRSKVCVHGVLLSLHRVCMIMVILWHPTMFLKWNVIMQNHKAWNKSVTSSQCWGSVWGSY